MLLEVASKDDGVKCKETCGDGDLDGRHGVMLLLVGCNKYIDLGF